MRQTFYSGRRVAVIKGSTVLTLWLFDDELDPLFPSIGNHVRVLDVPRTRENLRHLRQFAVDWAAHGISWCDQKARGGVLPMRGGSWIYESDPGWVPFVERMDLHRKSGWADRDCYLMAKKAMAERERMKVVTRD